MDERKLAVLRAIVTDYVASHGPIGSKALVERHRLEVSAATIRNDMASLEEEGYLTHPHTSAGRIPTDKGYRLFVDRLASVKPLSVAERRAIVRFMEGVCDIDDIVSRTVRLLAQITHQVAIVQYPVSVSARVRHIELLSLGAGRVLAIVIRSTGAVEQRSFELPDHSEAELASLRDWVNAATVGKTVTDALEVMSVALNEAVSDELLRVGRLLTALIDMLSADPGARVMVGGVPNLARFNAEYETTVKPVLEMLEEQVVLLKLLGEAVKPGDGEVAVRIGDENGYVPLRSTSLVMSGYGSPESAWATLGVVGPTRMDYPSTIAAVQAVANYVGRFLQEG
ncbi:MAG: heat-inducible transcriptional repressor HrcA [Propionibacteriaceae bacterium]|jgi:heat-inducible transcriptional repressor|nr:heat-inducible transcriptional repressor HrcA [Propionibacteriaceae bacterium]